MTTTADLERTSITRQRLSELLEAEDRLKRRADITESLAHALRAWSDTERRIEEFERQLETLTPGTSEFADAMYGQREAITTEQAARKAALEAYRSLELEEAR